MPLVPVGGGIADLAPDYFAAGALAVGVGSPLVGDAAHGGDLDGLRVRARLFRAVCRGEEPAHDLLDGHRDAGAATRRPRC